MSNPPPGAVPTSLTINQPNPVNTRGITAALSGSFNVPNRQPTDNPSFNFTIDMEGEMETIPGSGDIWAVFTSAFSLASQSWNGQAQGTGSARLRLRSRYRWGSNNGTWSAWSVWLNINTTVHAPSATGLAPSGGLRSRFEPILLTWNYQTASAFPADPQISSQVEYWQGMGTRTVVTVPGDANRFTIPAGTFSTEANINWRVRVRTAGSGTWDGWGNYSSQVSFQIRPIAVPALPSNLSPIVTQNPRGEIRTSWLHNPGNLTVYNEADPQIGSEIRLRQDGGAWITINGGIENQATVAANTFTITHAATQIEFQARTQTRVHGWGGWSAPAFFRLGATPPLAPTLIYPLNISVSATNGTLLEWGYNSPFDTFPSRFDIRYRIDNLAWITVSNFSAGSVPARSTITTQPISGQHRVEWQVLAYGELGDVGVWSDIGVFFTIGAPPAPTITNVSNSNRPVVTFSAPNVMAWELEIAVPSLSEGFDLRDNANVQRDVAVLPKAELAFPQAVMSSSKTMASEWEQQLRNTGMSVIYHTGIMPFSGNFSHMLGMFVANGNYLARVRIYNRYGLISGWGTLAFSISVTPPNPLILQAESMEFYNLLTFDGAGKTVFVYRTSPGSDDFIQIKDATDTTYFKDFTVQPGITYQYFVRVVGEDFGFADSNIVTARADFLHTTIARASTPHNMVKLLGQLDGKPTKEMSFMQHQTLTHFQGRSRPVLQVGQHTDKSVSFSFYVHLDDCKRLESLAQSGEVLILRDPRHGVIYGTISGLVKMQSDGFSAHNIVSFTFAESSFE